MKPEATFIPKPLRELAQRLDYERHMRAHPWLSSAAGLALLGTRSGLRELGWFRSFVERRSVDAAGNALPWFTYPAIAVLAAKVTPGLTVLEYGAGGSTRWWAERVAAVWAVEHHAGWVAELGPQLPANAHLLKRSLDDGDAYPSAALDALRAAGRPFDVVVIDGRRRNRCAGPALQVLSAGGVIVWDNSERAKYQSGQQQLRDAGFRDLVLPGMGPINPWLAATTIWYRDGNVLGL